MQAKYHDPIQNNNVPDNVAQMSSNPYQMQNINPIYQQSSNNLYKQPNLNQNYNFENQGHQPNNFPPNNLVPLGQPVFYNQPAPPTVFVVNRNVGQNCPYCHLSTTSYTEKVPGTKTWFWCVLLCCIGCNMGCCFIPFCVDSCQDTRFICANCNRTKFTQQRPIC